jgi:hypothetical protein
MQLYKQELNYLNLIIIIIIIITSSVLFIIKRYNYY